MEVPFRDRTNYPPYVRYVAEHLAELRGTSLTKISELSSQNFHNLFFKQLPKISA